MTDAAERLLLLEQHVQRAVELIERLRAENARLTKELDASRQREEAVGRLEADNRRLQEERQALLGHVEGMLKELARIEAG
jgi:FtsZ-binding cell division protein ZapB